MTVILTYEGFTLVERKSGGYCSTINGKTIAFDTASQWKQYIDIVIIKSKKK